VVMRTMPRWSTLAIWYHHRRVLFVCVCRPDAGLEIGANVGSGAATGAGVGGQVPLLVALNGLKSDAGQASALIVVYTLLHFDG
jgi:hypothetical protein